jgi:Predicted AAA-ATPase/PD-(D/E)XK nuclease superfamily
MIKIPYGQSDFKGMMEGGFFYQDRTEFIEKLEKWNSNFPVFLRPRRFGKSLFIMTLHYYYGWEYKTEFQKLFGHLYIGKHPTGLENSFMVLSLEFSRIDTATHESTYRGFLANVIDGARTFMSAYKSFFSEEDKRTVLAQSSPEAVVKTIFSIAQSNKIPHKIYLLIDEYDHFANELLSFDMGRFKTDVSQNGFVRKFYESLKTATRNGVIDRIFITGVSPITLDSLTSGFNISDNISLNPVFHDMMGFTHTEVEAILHESAILVEKIPTMMSDLTEWYDGYLFAPDAGVPLFNPDMVLYFLREYSIRNTYPYEMLDTNIISDYRKIRNIFNIGGSETEKFELLETLVKTGSISFALTRIYNLERSFTQDDFLSLLYYMGMLTIKDIRGMRWRFQVPNYVIKKLYFEYFTAIYLEKTRFANTRIPLDDSIDNLVNEGNPDPFFKVIAHILKENHSNRDEMVYGEKHLQTLMIGILYPFEAYYIRSEMEINRGYPDIFIEKMPDKPINYEIVLELKYVKKSAVKADRAKKKPLGESLLEKVVEEAEIQLDGYMTSPRYSRPDVRGFYVVFLGGEVFKWEEWGKY